MHLRYRERQKQKMDIPNSIAIADFSHMIHVAFHAAGPEKTGDIVIQQMAALRSGCERVIIALDTKPYRRTAVYDGYKSGRKSEPELANIWDRTLERLVAEGYATARAAGEEADDVMASLAHIYVEEYGCDDVRLVTADKDIASCLRPGVRWFVPIVGKRDEYEVRDAAWVEAHFGGVDWIAEKKIGPTPAEVPLVLAIMGDTSDRIPGVRGIGLKGAVALVKTYGTPEAMANGLIAESNSAKLKGKDLAKFWQNFAAGQAEIPKWLSLTVLKTDVEFDVHPLKFLEYVAPKPLAKPLPPVPAEDEISDADDSMFYAKNEQAEEWPTQDIDWAAIEKATAERERAELAAALPVAPAPEQRSAADRQVAAARAMAADRVVAAHPTVPRESAESMVNAQHAQKRAPLIGKDPNADRVLADAAAEREHLRIEQMAADARERVATGQTDPSTGKVAGYKHAPKAAASAESSASSPPVMPATTAAAEVVPKTQGPQSTALAPPSWALAVQPKSVEGMMWLAERFLNSRYSAFATTEGTFAIMCLGRELGMGAMQSLMSFCDVKGKPFMWAHAMRARVLSSPVCEYLINTECTAEASTWVTRRRGWPDGVTSTYRFTYAEAEKIGLTTGTNRENWQRNPRSLVDKTASSRLIRQVYADVLWGLHSIEESA